MNTSSNAVPDAFQAQSVPINSLPPTHAFYWSLRRELWEFRSIYLAPLIASALFLFGFLISLMHLPSRTRGIAALDPVQQQKAILSPYHMAAGLLMLVTLIVGVFYCLDALYGERRDRSILFWKSLPVSDLTAVLSKASIPFVVLPVIGFSLTVILQLIMLVLSSIVLAASGFAPALLWSNLSFFRSSFLLLYHLVTVHVIWHAPFYAWFLLISAWARRAPFLWAILPPLFVAVLERAAFNTNYFAFFLLHRAYGGAEAIPPPHSMPMDPMTHLTFAHYLTSPGLWLGLLATAAFLAAAVRLRRHQSPV